MGKPWYTNYEELRAQVVEQKQRFEARAKQIGAPIDAVVAEFQRDLIARTVHESNWQEGIYLDTGRTRELSDAAFEWIDRLIPSTTGPTLDLERLCQNHKADVLRHKRAGASAEELATFNLSRAHWAVHYVAFELARRQATSLARALSSIEASLSGASVAELSEDMRQGFNVVRELKASKTPLSAPYSDEIQTEGELIQRWLEEAKSEDLMHPMKVEYLHFLHRVTMMAVLPAAKLGRFRRHAVHVGNRDLYFPPAVAVPALMDEFCRNFPPILPGVVQYDPILKAAEVSYRFVRVHPYADGNGRVSRLLMNVVLWMHFQLPACLKADGKGRNRYGQALRRADRGNIKPLACLIALSVRDTYEQLNAALTPFQPAQLGAKQEG